MLNTQPTGTDISRQDSVGNSGAISLSPTLEVEILPIIIINKIIIIIIIVVVVIIIIIIITIIIN